MTKTINFNLDPFKLPKKYLFQNNESLTENKYIDDNALFVYFCLLNGLFNNKTNSKYNKNNPKLGDEASFLFFHPFEWTSIDFISFLLFVSQKYGLEIENIKIMLSAIQDEYEVSYEPRKYDGAYKWILELKEKKKKREEVILFDKFTSGTLCVADIERALIYADRITPMDDNESQMYLSKDIFKKILDYTSFSFSEASVKKSKIKIDTDAYIKAFMEGKLIRSSKPKRIGNTSVSQSENIFTFTKHNLLFREYLQKMYDDFGKIISIENIFENKFPNLEYPDAEFIRKRFKERNFFFLHILFAFHKQKLIKLLYVGSNLDFYEDEKSNYRAKIEILPKFFNDTSSKTLYFDIDKSRLYVEGKKIKIQKFSDQYHLLKILFENEKVLSEEWFYSKIAELYDGEENFKDKKFYNAVYQIKQKIAKETGIKDFFITTNQSFKINNKYLTSS